ncbi:MbtH domain protein [Listeria welshimeri]|nr:MbtH domain protein [Listeria welshimeri]
MDDLVKRLSEKEQSVILGGPNPSVDEFNKQLSKIGYTFIKFTETNGETNLGVRIDGEKTDLSRAGFVNNTGVVHINGYLTLNFVSVKCIAEINLETLSGTGKLEIENTNLRL